MSSVSSCYLITNGDQAETFLSLEDDIELRHIMPDAVEFSVRATLPINNWNDKDLFEAQIAPARSDETCAFVRDGRKVRTKRRGNWQNNFWSAEILTKARSQRNNVRIRIKLNPTKFGALNEVRRCFGSQNLNPPTANEILQEIARFTLDRNSNFLPLSTDNGFRNNSNPIFFNAISSCIAEIQRSLRFSGVGLDHEFGHPLEQSAGSSPIYDRTLIIDWTSWTLIRMEHYSELYVNDAQSIIRGGYRYQSINQNDVTTSVFSLHRTDANLTTALERRNGSLSYALRGSPAHKVVVYNKHPNFIRIEARYVVGSSERPFSFQTYKQMGLQGLLQCESNLRTNAQSVIQTNQVVLLNTSQSDCFEGERQFLSLLQIISRELPEARQQAWLNFFIETGGAVRIKSDDRERRQERETIRSLVSAGLLSASSQRAAFTATPALHRYLSALRSVRETWD